MSLLKRIESARPAARADLARARTCRPRWVRPLGSACPVPRVSPAPRSPRRRPCPSACCRRSRSASRSATRSTAIQQRVIADLDPKLDLSNQVEVRRQIEEIFSIAVDEEGLALTRAERVRMLEQITDEIVGLGPLEPLLRDESITEVMVNGPRQVYIERSWQARADERHVPERRPRHAHHRPHHRADRPARRRVQPDGRRAPHRRLAASTRSSRHSPWSGRCSPSASSPPRRSRSTTSSASARPRRTCSTS